MSLSSGMRLGSYEILTLIGAGGMGEVYRAKDTRLGRDVALKILPPAFTSDAERVARFRREAQVLASLNHPHIAQIHGLDESEGTQFLVLELVDGESLDRRIARGRIPVDEALGIAKQIAEALEAAHEKGIIHRDLKPANIALTRDGSVKVLDFGLAKATEAASVTALDATNSPTITTPAMMTSVGVILGTAAYMSPEQAKGKPADQRSDVWAFGCVLFEMLTGGQPFGGETVADVLASVLVREPGYRALPRNINPRLQELLKRCFEKNPRQRWHAVGDLRAEVETIAAAPIVAAQDGDIRRWSKPLQAGALITVSVAFGLLGLFVGMHAVPSTPPPDLGRFSIPLPPGQRWRGIARRVMSISPDGKQIVYAANDRLFVRVLSELTPKPLAGIENVQGILDPVFSPDGQFIAFSANDRIVRRVASTGGTAVTIAQVANAGMSWGADGILMGGTGAVMRLNPNGGSPETVVQLGQGELAFRPEMLPGGRAVLFTLLDFPTLASVAVDFSATRVVVQRLGSKDRTVIAEGGSDAHYLPTGHVVYAIGGVLFARRFDPTRLEALGTPTPIVEGVERGIGPSFGTASVQYAVSNTGTLVYVPGPASTLAGQRRLVAIDHSGIATPLKVPQGAYESPRISPDGKQVAVATDDGKQANVYLYELSGASAMRQLTFEGRNRNPMWSPDGQRVVFQSDRGGDRGIWWQRADGRGVAERLTTAGKTESHIPESFLPHSDTFSFSLVNPTSATLWTFSIGQRKAVAFDDVHSAAPLNSVFSPDGRWIAYTLRGTLPIIGAAVYVQPVPPTGAKFLAAPAGASGGHHPEWSPDGTRLFYFPGPDPLVSVPVMVRNGFVVGEPTPVPGAFPANTSTISGRNHDIAPDGSRIIAVDLSGEQEPRQGGLGGVAQRIDVVLNWFTELQQRVPTR